MLHANLVPVTVVEVSVRRPHSKLTKLNFHCKDIHFIQTQQSRVQFYLESSVSESIQYQTFASLTCTILLRANQMVVLSHE